MPPSPPQVTWLRGKQMEVASTVFRPLGLSSHEEHGQGHATIDTSAEGGTGLSCSSTMSSSHVFGKQEPASVAGWCLLV